MSNQVLECFAGFMQRMGYSATQAVEEFSRLNGMTKEQYLLTNRLGATFTLNRRDRINVYMTYENANNHATFFEA